jgi:hypothetical protein
MDMGEGIGPCGSSHSTVQNIQVGVGGGAFPTGRNGGTGKGVRGSAVLDMDVGGGRREREGGSTVLDMDMECGRWGLGGGVAALTVAHYICVRMRGWSCPKTVGVVTTYLTPRTVIWTA